MFTQAIFDLDWDLAVSQALLEASDRDLNPGEKVWDVVNRVQDRAREIYAMRKPKGKGGKKC